MSARVRNPSRPGDLRLDSIPELAGAASARVDLIETPPWQSPPDWWPPASSVEEWACYWWLTQPPRNFVEGLHFRRQVAMEAVGLFTGKQFTRIDFLFQIGGPSGATAPGDADWLAWDPYNTFTHPDRELDIEKREILANNDHPNTTALVWIESGMLLGWPDAVLPSALRGVDLSPRALGW